MFRFVITFQSSMLEKYTLLFSVVSLILTFLHQVNKINYIGATYIIGIIILKKINQIKYVLAISGTACAFDLLYLICHSSSSNWVYIKCIEFIIRLAAFCYELFWILSVVCYMKQKEAMASVVDKVARIEKQLLFRFCKPEEDICMDQLPPYGSPASYFINPSATVEEDGWMTSIYPDGVDYIPVEFSKLKPKSNVTVVPDPNVTVVPDDKATDVPVDNVTVVPVDNVTVVPDDKATVVSDADSPKSDDKEQQPAGPL